MAENDLTKEEWDVAMRTLLAAKDEPKADPKDDKGDKDKGGKKMPPEFFSKKFAKKSVKDLLTEIPSGGGWTSHTGRPEPKTTTMKEIPNNHPSGTGSSITPADSQKNDTDDNKNIQDEIPAGGGFTPRVGRPTGTERKMNEIPNNHPAVGGPRTPAEWDASGLKYGSDTSVGWSTGKNLPSPGNTTWGESPTKNSHDDSLPADGKHTTDTTNKAPRTSMARLGADADLGHSDDPNNHPASMPDGSFNLQQPGDVHAAVAKIQNAEKSTSQRPGIPAYADVKRHIARRAAALNVGHMIPADWQMMMAEKAELEVARKFDTEQRHNLARSGDARADGSFPIVTSEDLHNAIQAYGRANPAERSSVKAHILKRAKALGAGGDLLKHISGLGNGGN